MEPEPPAGDAATFGGPRVIGPGDGKVVDLGSLGVRFMVWSEESGGGFECLFEEAGEPREAAAGETPLDTRYGIEFDLESVERLCAEHDLVFPSE
jgi:hypothetical protein